MLTYLYLSLLVVVNSHLVLNIPEVWGIEDSQSLEQPLDNNMENWVCSGRPPGSGVVELVAGNTYEYETICGEIDLNSDGCLIGDWHTGDNNDDYSGCALSVNYGDYMNFNNFKYISVSSECPIRGSPTSFYVSRTIEDCENCVCSWTWAPSRTYSSPAQFYHNCFYCSISGGLGTQASMKNLDFINVQGAGFFDVTYNDIVSASDIEVEIQEPEPTPEESPEVPEPEESPEVPEPEPTTEIPDDAPGVPEPEIETSEGRCGEIEGRVVSCLTGCCSAWGFCGRTILHCGMDCQEEFGSCGEDNIEVVSSSRPQVSTSSPPSPMPSPTTTSVYGKCKRRN